MAREEVTSLEGFQKKYHFLVHLRSHHHRRGTSGRRRIAAVVHSITAIGFFACRTRSHFLCFGRLCAQTAAFAAHCFSTLLLQFVNRKELKGIAFDRRTNNHVTRKRTKPCE